jgi:hypothetical protein
MSMAVPLVSIGPTALAGDLFFLATSLNPKVTWNGRLLTRFAPHWQIADHLQELAGQAFKSKSQVDISRLLF